MIFTKVRVLIVDDNALMRTLVHDMLQRLGIHQIEQAADGKSALLEVIKFQPNLILSDIHMEPVSGLEFVKQVRSLPNSALAATTVIMMTADSSKETLDEAVTLGIRGYIVKPPILASLKSKIENAMK